MGGTAAEAAFTMIMLRGAIFFSRRLFLPYFLFFFLLLLIAFVPACLLFGSNLSPKSYHHHPAPPPPSVSCSRSTLKLRNFTDTRFHETLHARPVERFLNISFFSSHGYAGKYKGVTRVGKEGGKNAQLCSPAGLTLSISHVAQLEKADEQRREKSGGSGCLKSSRTGSIPLMIEPPCCVCIVELELRRSVFGSPGLSAQHTIPANASGSQMEERRGKKKVNRLQLPGDPAASHRAL